MTFSLSFVCLCFCSRVSLSSACLYVLSRAPSLSFLLNCVSFPAHNVFGSCLSVFHAAVFAFLSLFFKNCFFVFCSSLLLFLTSCVCLCLLSTLSVIISHRCQILTEHCCQTTSTTSRTTSISWNVNSSNKVEQETSKHVTLNTVSKHCQTISTVTPAEALLRFYF